MPEYLAPGVYLEEVQAGPQPIEGVSTSTTGFVGVAKRGPVNLPTLVTNTGEYLRAYGEFLDTSTYGPNRFVPYAADGFFANQGARAYILRVANLPTTELETSLRGRYDRFATTDGMQFALTAFLDIPTRQNSAHRELMADVAAGADQLPLGDTSDVALDTILRIDDGLGTEWVQVVGFEENGGVTISPTCEFPHRSGRPVRIMPAPATPHETTLDAATANSADSVYLRVADRAQVGVRLLVGAAPNPETTEVKDIEPAGPTPAPVDLTVDPPLLHPHAVGDPVVAYPQLPLAGGGVSTTLGSAASAGASATLVTPNGLALNTGDVVVVAGPATPTATARPEIVQLGSRVEDPAANTFTFTQQLQFDHPANAAVDKLDAAGVQTTHVAAAARISLASSTGLNEGDVVNIDDGAHSELVRLGEIPANPPFLVATTPPPRFAHGDGTSVGLAASPLQSDAQLSQDAAFGAASIHVDPLSGGFRVGQVLQVLDGAQTEVIHIATQEVDGAGAFTGEMRLLRPLKFQHRMANTELVALPQSAIRVIAGPARPDPDRWPEPGVWGNGIHVTVSPSSLVQTTLHALPSAGDGFVDVAGAGGIEPGTVLRLPGNRFRHVTRVDGNRVFLDRPIPDGGLGVATAQEGVVESLEFALRFSYGPVVQILDETFSKLSVDPRHSRYFVGIVNQGSSMVHVEDLVGANPPDRPTDGLPLLGSFYPGGGTDGLQAFTDAATRLSIFTGLSGPNADDRTGFYALLNEPRISIVAAPGQTDSSVQAALVAHCERHKYTFAILDSARGASLSDVQKQRSVFDSTYAAVYYPWLQILDALERQAALVPPSGYVAGVFARTDEQVGVHKAPANQLVVGARDLERPVSKEQQDVLNPVGINAIRSFPGRGILVWGARTVSTSDSTWRYVNVRRLFIMLEQSIDNATQYAPFQVNDVPLWNRLKAAVRSFLLVVWRSGALQGLKEDDAFFVRCGLGETMIPEDITAGRVIVEVGAAPVRPAEFVIFRIQQIVPTS